jgi:hypothetical protein
MRPHEPFGIVMAIAMAASAVPIVHRSGGSWINIVQMGEVRCGFVDEEKAALSVGRSVELDRDPVCWIILKFIECDILYLF